MTSTCEACGIKYMVMSEQAEDEGIELLYCPFCGEAPPTEMDVDSLDFEDEGWD